MARKFFLIKDRANLPQVAACEKCNQYKLTLEHYALGLMPLASRHSDARLYAEEYLKPRLAKNHKLQTGLVIHKEGSWERHPAGFLVPTRSIPIDMTKVYKLFAMVVTGLFSFHFKRTLDATWHVEVNMIDPDHEDKWIRPWIGYFRPLGDRVKNDLGRGTFVYEGFRSHGGPRLVAVAIYLVRSHAVRWGAAASWQGLHQTVGADPTSTRKRSSMIKLGRT
jgi:hypothetical protein